MYGGAVHTNIKQEKETTFIIVQNESSTKTLSSPSSPPSSTPTRFLNIGSTVSGRNIQNDTSCERVTFPCIKPTPTIRSSASARGAHQLGVHMPHEVIFLHRVPAVHAHEHFFLQRWVTTQSKHQSQGGEPVSGHREISDSPAKRRGLGAMKSSMDSPSGRTLTKCWISETAW